MPSVVSPCTFASPAAAVSAITIGTFRRNLRGDVEVEPFVNPTAQADDRSAVHLAGDLAAEHREALVHLFQALVRASGESWCLPAGSRCRALRRAASCPRGPERRIAFRLAPSTASDRPFSGNGDDWPVRREPLMKRSVAAIAAQGTTLLKVDMEAPMRER